MSKNKMDTQGGPISSKQTAMIIGITQRTKQSANLQIYKSTNFITE